VLILGAELSKYLPLNPAPVVQSTEHKALSLWAKASPFLERKEGVQGLVSLASPQCKGKITTCVQLNSNPVVVPKAARVSFFYITARKCLLSLVLIIQIELLFP
jgi:hypothetical protein